METEFSSNCMHPSSAVRSGSVSPGGLERKNSACVQSDSSQRWRSHSCRLASVHFNYRFAGKKTAKMTCELHLGDSFCYSLPSHQCRASPISLHRNVWYQHWKPFNFFIFKHDEKENNETHKEYYRQKKRDLFIFVWWNKSNKVQVFMLNTCRPSILPVLIWLHRGCWEPVLGGSQSSQVFCPTRHKMLPQSGIPGERIVTLVGQKSWLKVIISRRVKQHRYETSKD